MKSDKYTVINTKKHAGYASTRQVGPNLPQSFAHRAAERHPDWPSPLSTHQVFAYLATVFWWQFLQPFAHWFCTALHPEEDQRRLLRRQLSHESPCRCCTTEGAEEQAGPTQRQSSLCEGRNGGFVTPNVRVEAGPAARRQARAGENAPCATGPGLVACRWPRLNSNEGLGRTRKIALEFSCRKAARLAAPNNDGNAIDEDGIGQSLDSKLFLERLGTSGPQFVMNIDLG